MIKQRVLIEYPYLFRIGVAEFVSREQFIFQALVLKKRRDRHECVSLLSWTPCSLSFQGILGVASEGLAVSSRTLGCWGTLTASARLLFDRRREWGAVGESAQSEDLRVLSVSQASGRSEIYLRPDLHWTLNVIRGAVKSMTGSQWSGAKVVYSHLRFLLWSYQQFEETEKARGKGKTYQNERKCLCKRRKAHVFPSHLQLSSLMWVSKYKSEFWTILTTF